MQVKLCESWGMACDHCADPPHSLKLAAQKKQDDNAYAETTFYVSLVSAIVILVRVCCCRGV